MASIQRIFPALNTTALSFVRKPAGALGQWSQASAVYGAQGARYAGPSVGTAQIQAVPQFNAVPGGTTQTLLLAQFVSDPLRSVLIPALPCVWAPTVLPAPALTISSASQYQHPPPTGVALVGTTNLRI